MKSMKNLYDNLPRRERVFHNAYHRMAHYIYPNGAADQIRVEHFEPKSIKDWVAYYSIRGIRKSYDLITRYNTTQMTTEKWIQRCLILETVAGVPGMVGGMTRHLKSLRSLRRDKGWIHHLLQQADNERFHLFIFLDIKKPGFLERCFIIGLQGIFMNMFFLSYLINPVFSHRFVGYLQQEAVKTYTAMLQDIDNPNGILHNWNQIKPTDQIKEYYQLDDKASMRDVINCVRADEACHRATNHFLASVSQDYEIREQFVKVINHSPQQKAPQIEKEQNKAEQLKK